MARGGSLIVPVAGSSKQIRRESAGKRSGASASTPAKPGLSQVHTPGSSRSHPIDLSFEETEDENDNINTSPIPKANRIVVIRNDAPRPQVTHARTQQPTTPDLNRPQPRREAASDPGPQSRVRRNILQSRVVTGQQGDTLPCGRPAYPKPQGEWSKKHRDRCPKCREQQNGENKTEESKDEDVSVLRSCVRAEIGHGRLSSSGSSGEDGRSEDDLGIREAREAQDARMLNHLLLQTAKSRLTSKETPGYLYILRNPKTPGLLKLGCSVNAIDRAKQHKAKCGLETSWVHISNCVTKMKRAEKLAKLDMAHLRKDWKCSSCSQTHTEWFQVDEDQARKVAERWITWINDQSPYTQSGTLQPIWAWLMDFHRTPRGDFDHNARWAHWDAALLYPSRSDSKKFKDHEKRMGVAREPDTDAAPPARSSPSVTKRPDAQPLPLAERASDKALDRRQKGNTYTFINNVNVNRDYVGNAVNVGSSRS
ncbi:hypothetical protein OPT61_g572 [Boeremia exigua]|uniref:Uncharacterized protein n=1 Tax=Boeremia exigua TaxID=749465 RepID=A0ACC2ITD1_9PLEO|nr:hypothetical protein OPT61_g572 [Boeremia exigua]